MRRVKRGQSYQILAAIVACSVVVHLLSVILWKDVRLINETLHSTIEALGAAVAIFMATVLLWGREEEYGGRLFLTAMGFLGMGILDAFHAAATLEKGFVLLRSAAGLTGSFWLLLVWLPGLPPKKGGGRRLAASIVAAGCVLFGIWITSVRWALPEMIQGGSFTAPAIAINIMAGVFFVISAVRFIIDFHRSERPEIFLFACMAMMFGIAQLSFPFSALWDVTWWLWHALRLIAYILVLGFVVFERKEAEDKIKKLNQDLRFHATQLEASYKDMESFSYSASHDLRSPLIKINALSRILVKDYGDRLDDNGRHLLKRIQETVKKMEQLINDLLAFSHVSSKEISKSEMNMGALTKEVFEELKPTILNRSVQLKINDLPSAHGDQSMMRQVIANLLSNAIKFTKAKEIAIIEVGGNTEGNENIYYVKDNGAGFDMVHADKLFTLFQRLHSPNEFEGTGIGLVIVKRIIDKHGGRVWAEGKPNEGAKFYFSLPIQEKVS